MIFNFFKVLFKGKKGVGIVRDYILVKNIRGRFYYKYVVRLNNTDYLSGDYLCMSDAATPRKHYGCEVEMYYLEEEKICTLWNKKDFVLVIAITIAIVAAIILQNIL